MARYLEKSSDREDNCGKMASFHMSCVLVRVQPGKTEREANQHQSKSLDSSDALAFQYQFQLPVFELSNNELSNIHPSVADICDEIQRTKRCIY
jgi:hypothetical protein